MLKKKIESSTYIPNKLLDFLFPRLPEAEMRCLLYICRRTCGFHQDSDYIAHSQFILGIVNKKEDRLDYGTGLSKKSVYLALRNLEMAGIILVNRGGRTNEYTINLKVNSENAVKKIKELRKKYENDKKIALLSKQKSAGSDP